MPSKISGITVRADRAGLVPVLQFSQTLEVGHCVPGGSQRSRECAHGAAALLPEQAHSAGFPSTWMSFVSFCHSAGQDRGINCSGQPCSQSHFPKLSRVISLPSQHGSPGAGGASPDPDVLQLLLKDTRGILQCIKGWLTGEVALGSLE